MNALQFTDLLEVLHRIAHALERDQGCNGWVDPMNHWRVRHTSPCPYHDKPRLPEDWDTDEIRIGDDDGHAD